MDKMTLCSEKSCCPTVEKQDGIFIIKDDFGGSVSLSEKELSMLYSEFLELK